MAVTFVVVLLNSRFTHFSSFIILVQRHWISHHHLTNIFLYLFFSFSNFVSYCLFAAEVQHHHLTKRQETEAVVTGLQESRTQFWVKKQKKMFLFNFSRFFLKNPEEFPFVASQETRRWSVAAITGSSASWPTGSLSVWAWPIAQAWAASTN